MNSGTSIISGFRRKSEAESWAEAANKSKPDSAFAREDDYVDKDGVTRKRWVVVVNEVVRSVS